MQRSRLASTRRQFLRGSGSAAALLALARLPAGAAPSANTATGVRSSIFDARGREILTQIVERMVETGEPDAPAVRDTRAIQVIEALCSGLDPALVEPLPMLMRAVEWSPLLFDWRLTPFTRLDAAGQDACLRGWMTSRFTLRRLAFFALRNLAFVGWYSQEASWSLIGYSGPLLGEPTP